MLACQLVEAHLLLGPGHTWSRRHPGAAKKRFGDARLDYLLVQWAGRGAVLSADPGG